MYRSVNHSAHPAADRSRQTPAACYRYRHTDMTSFNTTPTQLMMTSPRNDNPAALNESRIRSRVIEPYYGYDTPVIALEHSLTPVSQNICSTPVLRSSPRHNSSTPVAVHRNTNSSSPRHTTSTPVGGLHISARSTPVSCTSSRYNSTPVPVPHHQPSCSTPVPHPRGVRPIQCSTPAPWRCRQDDDSDLPRSFDITRSSSRRPGGGEPVYGVTSSYIDLLPDETLTVLFRSGLDSRDLCRCAAVCRRWNRLVWNPILWTSIDLGELVGLDADRALRALTRILSRDTPTVCITVVKVVLSGCLRLTDEGLYTIARRCTELTRLEVTRCCLVTNVAVFEVVSRCVSLIHLDLTGCEQVTCISLTPEANMAAVTYGHQVYLRLVDMSDCSRLDDSGLQLVVTCCPALVKLYIRRCPLVTDLGLQYIGAYLPSLRELSVADCRRITDRGVSELAARRGSTLRYLSVARVDRLTGNVSKWATLLFPGLCRNGP